MRCTATGTVWIWRTLAALLLMGGIAQAEDITIPGPDGIELKSKLFQPTRAGPVPAIVLLHGCGGPFPSRDKQWTDLFTNAGQIVLLPDSFSSRGLGSQCNTAEGQRTVTPGGLRRGDALAAARWLGFRAPARRRHDHGLVKWRCNDPPRQRPSGCPERAHPRVDCLLPRLRVSRALGLVEAVGAASRAGRRGGRLDTGSPLPRPGTQAWLGDDAGGLSRRLSRLRCARHAGAPAQLRARTGPCRH